jgi:PAS domain S-box-containing protein
MKPPSDPNEKIGTGQQLSSALAEFEGMDVCMLGLLAEGKIVYANPAACDLFGCPKECLLGQAFQVIAPTIAGDAWTSFWAGVDRNGGGGLPAQIAVRRHNHEEIMVKCRALRLQAAEGAGCVIFLSRADAEPKVAIDIEAHRHQLVQILEALNNPVVSLNERHEITYLNRAACRQFLTTLHEAVGKTAFDFFPRKHAEAIWKMEQQVLDTGRTETYAGDAYLQSRFGGPAVFLPFTDPRSSEKRILIVVENGSEPFLFPELKLQNGALAETRTGPADLRRNVNEGALGIYLKDADNEILWVNRSYADMLGFEPQDLVGKRVDDVVNDPELITRLRQEDETVLRTGRPLLGLVKQPRPDQPKLVRIDKLPYFDRSGNVTGIIGLAVELPAPPQEAEAVREELVATSRRLEDTETALRVVLDQREKDAAQNKEKLGERVKSLVLPYLENLRQTKLNKNQQAYVELIEENLKSFYDANYAKLSGPEYKLSPTELKVAQLVRDGKTNKEIAKLMHLSKSTILTHRHHVRVKLGIRNKKVNLRSLLNT